MRKSYAVEVTFYLEDFDGDEEAAYQRITRVLESYDLPSNIDWHQHEDSVSEWNPEG